MERLSFELPASLLAHTERCPDLAVRLRIAANAEAAHQDFAMPRRDDPEHRPDLAAGLPLVEPTPWVLGIRVGDEVYERGALVPGGRVEGCRDARRLAQRPHPLDGEAGARGDRLGARRSRALPAQLRLRPLDRREPSGGMRG